MITLSLNILDIVQNSIRAKADIISIEINECVKDNEYVIKIEDNGSGIPKEILENITNPFVTTRTKRRMGLGLPLIKYHAELTGGSLEINSENKRGTSLTARFYHNHIDRQPLGDIAGVIKILIAANPKIEFIYSHSTDKGEYRFSSMETKEYLEVETLYDSTLLNEIESMINENLKEIEAAEITTNNYRQS
jgi:DNA mismatch repair ATPase MutL